MKTKKLTLALLLLAAVANATSGKITDATLGDPLGLADEFPINRGGTDRKITGEATAGELCSKTLTESSATTVVNVTVASGASAGGTLTYHVFASDGTDHQDLTGAFYYAAVNKAGTVTAGSPSAIGTALNAVSTGTLTCTPTAVANGNSVDLKLNCVSSLTQNVFTAWLRPSNIGAGTVTCP